MIYAVKAASVFAATQAASFKGAMSRGSGSTST